MLANPMIPSLANAILELAEQAMPGGVTMGQVVEALEAHGHEVELVEGELWRLLELRRLTPCGYICRKVRRRDPRGKIEHARSYELLFAPWSAELDRQIELPLGGEDEG